MFFRHCSIRQKLTFIIMTISSISVILTAMAVTWYGIYSMRQNMVDELSSTAALLGDRNSAALLAGNHSEASSNLKLLSVKSDVLFSCLYSKTGNMFAFYTGENVAARCPRVVKNELAFENKRLKISQVIEHAGEIIGYIYLESSTVPIKQYVKKQMLMSMCVMAGVLALSSLMALMLQRSISRPILNLANTAKDITERKDYNIRAVKYEHNELGLLVDAFNTMLTHIAFRDRELIAKTNELVLAKEIAESASTAKSDFLASISHELRTPLNAIINFSEIQKNEMLGPMHNPKYVEYAKDIHKSGCHLLEIINDILDLSKAEAGMIEFKLQAFNIVDTIEECIVTLKEHAQRKGIIISKILQEDLPSLYADPTRIKQVILNVLSNAIKFTEPGGEVSIMAKVTQRREDVTNDFFIIISDTGIGMSKEDLEVALKRFGQVDSGLSRRFEGAGLGLPLTKKLVEMQQGAFMIESEPGQGTKVTVRFPETMICYHHRFEERMMVRG